jgi:branched-chain amino acid transport system substrate-binding protein
MIRSTHAVRAAALAGAAALVLAACSSGDSGDDATDGASADSGSPLIVGTLLPQTGSLAQLGPPEIAGVDLAVKDINDAGGVNGVPVTVSHKDSGPTSDLATIGTPSAKALIEEGVHVIIGAASSGLSLGVVGPITDAEIVQISPANTAADLSGISPYYFRTAPPDEVQGQALATQIIADGKKNVGILVFDDPYGTGLRGFIQNNLEPAGVKVTYGAEGAGQDFPPELQDYSTEVGEVIATNPDAIVIITFDEVRVIVPQLVQAGYDMSNVYLVDGNVASFKQDPADSSKFFFDPGTMEGAQGTNPGANPTDDFKARLLEVNPDLKDFNYGPESYDATILAALAAVKGGQNDGPTVQANMAAVSGTTDGEECATFADCVELLKDGKEITYQAVSGVGPFNENNDPSSAFVGIYKYDAENVPVWQKAEFGEVKGS